MWLVVTDVFNDINDPGIKLRVVNEVNTDLIERVHGNRNGGLTLHLQSGTMIDISEDWAYWKKNVSVGGE